MSLNFKMFWLLCFVGTTLLTESLCDLPRLEIQPEGTQVTKPVGSSLALTCTPNVENSQLVQQLEWRDAKNRRIDATNREAPLYIQRLSGESGLILIFSKLTENLAGTYTCSASYSNSEKMVASTKVNTIVDITWIDAPESQYPVIGTNYKIKCVVKANPAPLVNWLKDGEDIASNDRYVTENNGLVLKNVRESDDGVYTCRAVVFSTGQIETKNIKVEVQVPPKIREMNSVEIVEGEEASIVCNGTGKPPPSYTWIKEKTREDLANANRFTVKKSTGLLIIHKVEFNDDSSYKCVAKNQAGEDETSVKINVLVKPKIYEFLNITAPVGSTTKIICKAKGRPSPTIAFKKFSTKEPFQEGVQPFDERIMQENIFNDEKGETTGILHFKNLKRYDDGLYACMATNKVETAYQNGHITVEFPPTFEKTENYPPVWSWNNKPGNLTCIAESIPNATIQWRYNGQYIENDVNQNIQKQGNGPISYLLVRPYNEHRYYATYDCVATNKLGTATKQIELRQATVPQHIQQAKPESITATTIKFNIIGPPNFHGLPLRSITIQYQTERERSWDTAKEHTWSYNGSYILENLIPEEVYNFRFAARNDVGLGGWSANQQIKMPRRSVPAEPKIIVDGNIPNTESNLVATDLVTNSHYADHFKLQWTVPNDNGDPIDSYTIRYCVTQKVVGVWRDSESECSGEIIQSFQHTTYDMSSLRPDTTYKVELRAHNAIGLSSPAEIRVRTARGLNTIVYQNDDPSISSAAIIGIVVAAFFVILIIVDIICCCVNRAGILASLCDCLRSKPADEEEAKLGSLYSWRFPLPYCSYKAAPAHPSSLNLPQPIKLVPSSMEEKEPLKSEANEQPLLMNGVDKCNISVEYDGKQVYTKSGEIIGKHSVV